MSILKNVQPENVFHFFEEISKIPHGSYHTKEISDYLVAFAKKRGLECFQDDSDNVIIIKEATAGYEEAASIILQGHIDMVCEKDETSNIDFLTEGLDLYIEGDFLKAKGTTLGADDGIAVAYALAILDSDSISHPRLEVVLTSDEEVGLLGAEAVDLSMLKGHILLNIDSDIEGHFLTSCAGGATAHVRIPVSRQELNGVEYIIKISGLLGGHSGSEIDKERANAVIVMGRLLKHTEERVSFGILNLDGGLKDNAIPREASARVIVPTDACSDFEETIQSMKVTLQKEFTTSDPDLTVTLQRKESVSGSALSYSSMQKILFYLRNVPNGCIHVCPHMKGLVETSLNAGILKLSEDEFYVCDSVRSNVPSRKQELLSKMTYLAEFLGGTLEVKGEYPAWEYKQESVLREKVKIVYHEISGKEPVFEAIHAGLECGILSSKIKDLDAISFGPDNFDIHTPKERLSISSTKRVYEFLIALLGSMKV